jgi:hypothetical protein
VGPPRQTTTRVQDGTPTAGPVVEIKESIGGWPLFEADDLDAAIEQAARSPVVANGRRGFPSSRMGGAGRCAPGGGGMEHADDEKLLMPSPSHEPEEQLRSSGSLDSCRGGSAATLPHRAIVDTVAECGLRQAVPMREATTPRKPVLVSRPRSHGTSDEAAQDQKA